MLECVRKLAKILWYSGDVRLGKRPVRKQDFFFQIRFYTNIVTDALGYLKTRGKTRPFWLPENPNFDKKKPPKIVTRTRLLLPKGITSLTLVNLNFAPAFKQFIYMLIQFRCGIAINECFGGISVLEYVLRNSYDISVVSCHKSLLLGCDQLRQ